MTTTQQLPLVRKRLRYLAGCLLLCTISSVAQTLQPAFEVATVKPAPPQSDPLTGNWSLPGIGSFRANHVSLAVLIRIAYNIDDSQIANRPAWLNDSLYDIVAKPEPGIKLSREELRPRLQALLLQRFHLVVHQEIRMSSGYALIVAKGGPHLTPTKAEHFPGWRSNVSPGQMRGVNWTMAQFAQFLTEAAGFPVDDATGIPGSYDVSFAYNPIPDADSTLQPLPGALTAATGLMLQPKKIPVTTIVIDSVDKVPTEN